MANLSNQDYMWLRNKCVPTRYDDSEFEHGPCQLENGKVKFPGLGPVRLNILKSMIPNRISRVGSLIRDIDMAETSEEPQPAEYWLIKALKMKSKRSKTAQKIIRRIQQLQAEDTN